MWHRNEFSVPIYHTVCLLRAPKLYARVAVNAQGEYLQAIGGIRCKDCNRMSIKLCPINGMSCCSVLSLFFTS